MPSLWPIGAAALLGFAVYQLWTAFTRGRIRVRYTTDVTRAEAPITFWLLVLLHALILAAAALAAVVYVQRAVTHGIDWSPASDFIRK
jgi:hypothetical protein